MKLAGFLADHKVEEVPNVQPPRCQFDASTACEMPMMVPRHQHLERDFHVELFKRYQLT